MLKTSNKAVKRLCQFLSKRSIAVIKHSVAVSSVKAFTCAALRFNVSIKENLFLELLIVSLESEENKISTLTGIRVKARELESF